MHDTNHDHCIILGKTPTIAKCACVFVSDVGTHKSVLMVMVVRSNVQHQFFSNYTIIIQFVQIC
jgi:hypothetical protein